MIVVLIIGILLAIAVPNFIYVREQTRRKACIGNMRKIEWAKDSFLMDKRLDQETTPTPTDLYPADGTGYIKTPPQCPSGGAYTINDGLNDPTCSRAADKHLINGN